MQNRLSLAELKAKANVVTNTEFITGGTNDGCHISPTSTTDKPVTLGTNTGGSIKW